MAHLPFLRRCLSAFIALASLQLALIATGGSFASSGVVLLDPAQITHDAADARFSAAGRTTPACNERNDQRRMPECHEAPSAAPEGMATVAAEEADEELIGEACSTELRDAEPASVAVPSAARVHSLRSRIALERPPRA